MSQHSPVVTVTECDLVVIAGALCPPVSHAVDALSPADRITTVQANLTGEMSRATERLRVIINHLDRPPAAIVSSLHFFSLADRLHLRVFLARGASFPSGAARRGRQLRC